MSKSKVVLVISLAILLGLGAGLIFFPRATTGQGFSEVAREHLIQQETAFLIQFDIINHEGRDAQYTVKAAVDDAQDTQDVLIPDGQSFTYGYHIYPDKLTRGNVNLAVYEEGQALPIADINYHLK